MQRSRARLLCRAASFPDIAESIFSRIQRRPLRRRMQCHKCCAGDKRCRDPCTHCRQWPAPCVCSPAAAAVDTPMRFPFDTLFKSCPHAGPEFTNANKARRSRSLGGHLHRHMAMLCLLLTRRRVLEGGGVSLCGDTGVWRRFVHSSPGKFDENRKGKSSSSLPLVSRWGWGGVRSAERARLDRVGGSRWGWVL